MINGNIPDAWWRGSYGTIQLLKKDSIIYVLNNWNGEFYSDCYKSDMRGVPTNSKERFIIRPIKNLDGYEIFLEN